MGQPRYVRVGDTLTNIIDSKTKEMVTYDKVGNWYDGTAMDNSKADGDIYRKLKSEFFLKNMPFFGENFLEKDTMASLRAISPTEVLLLKMQYYKGVKLNGYYQKGDTPSPIEYFISTTSVGDNGGSVVVVSGIKLEHDFGNEVNSKYYGVEVSGFNIANFFSYKTSNCNYILDSVNAVIPTFITFNSYSDISIKFVNSSLKINTVHNQGLLYFNLSNRIRLYNIVLIGADLNPPPATIAYNHYGIKFNSCDDCEVHNSDVRKMPTGGVLAVNTNNVGVYNSYFEGNKDMADLYLNYAVPLAALSNIKAIGNTCLSQNRYGIVVQGYGKDVAITGNTVKHKHEYGILVYRFDNDQTNYWTNVNVSDNLVEDISDNPDMTLTYRSGMGIYVQTAKKVICVNNIVRDALKNRNEFPISRTLVPAAISLGGTSEVVCTNNYIENSGVDGIGISEGGAGGDASLIANNVCLNQKYNGISVSGAYNVTVTSNELKNNVPSIGAGVFITSTSVVTNRVKVSDNSMSNFNYGVQVTKGAGVSISTVTIESNLILDSLFNSIAIVDLSDGRVSGNTCTQFSRPNTSTYYAIAVNLTTNIVVIGNSSFGSGANTFFRGLSVTNSTNPLIANNSMYGITDIANALNIASNTKQVVAFNPNTRQLNAVVADHAIGNDFTTGSPPRLVYKTAIPVLADGAFAVGSITWNMNPAAGTPTGWRCTVAGTPGTWVAFGINGALQTAASADTATPPSGSYTQSEVQAILTELRDLKTKLRAANLLAP